MDTDFARGVQKAAAVICGCTHKRGFNTQPKSFSVGLSLLSVCNHDNALLKDEYNLSFKGRIRGAIGIREVSFWYMPGIGDRDKRIKTMRDMRFQKVAKIFLKMVKKILAS